MACYPACSTIAWLDLVSHNALAEATKDFRKRSQAHEAVGVPPRRPSSGPSRQNRLQTRYTAQQAGTFMVKTCQIPILQTCIAMEGLLLTDEQQIKGLKHAIARANYLIADDNFHQKPLPLHPWIAFLAPFMIRFPPLVMSGPIAQSSFATKWTDKAC